MRDAKELEQINVANWLQEALGDNCIVRYDEGDSCFTRVYFKPLNIMTAEVLNTEMKKGISTTPFLAKREDIAKAYVLNLL